MNNKYRVILLSMIIVALAVFSFIRIVSVKNLEIALLEKEIIDLEQKVDNMTQAMEIVVLEQDDKKIEEKDEVVLEENNHMFLKDGNYDIELFSDYDVYSDHELVYKPAFGPIAIINPFAVGYTGGVKVMEQVGEHLSRVSIEGVIPTWLLEETKATYSSFYEKKYMYVKEESKIMLSPEEDSLMVNIFSRGKAVTVIDEHEDWYYVDVFLAYDANEIYKGWIKKDNLTYYDDFIDATEIEVNVMNGFDTDSQELHPNGLWGRIDKETEEFYYIASFGASCFEVRKDSLEPFFYRPKE